jgi:serine protease Do
VVARTLRQSYLAHSPLPSVRMDRVILRHVKGSKANQVDEYSHATFRVLLFGRDPRADVCFEGAADRRVGRRHALMARDESNPNHFTITDLQSRNGTFVNGQRIIGVRSLVPGDRIQFGEDGPEFEFDLLPSLGATSRAAPRTIAPPW